MPLRALINGREVLSPLLSDSEWEALRADVAAHNWPVRLSCCDGEGYLRRSRLGTRHFAHKRNAGCELAGETQEHLKAKADIVEASRAAGYDALTEVAGEGWRADVLVTRPNTEPPQRIAFEVQWSFLRFEDALYRQRRYARDAVRGCWFFRNPPPQMMARAEPGKPPELKARRDLPLFHLWVNADRSFSITLSGQLYPLAEFVRALLERRIRYAEVARAAPKQTLHVGLIDVPCAGCGTRAAVYQVETELVSRCGLRFTPDESWYSETFAFKPEVVAAVRSVLSTSRTLAAIQPHGDEGALTFVCPNCGRPIPRETVEMAAYGRHLDTFEVPVTLRKAVYGRLSHWCYPPDGRFCAAGHPPPSPDDKRR